MSVIVPNHNEKKETTVIQVAQIIELGNVTELTLGGDGYNNEYMRPNAKDRRP